MGPPGSGKGTYGRLLSVAWNQTPIYSVSDILRHHQHHQQQQQQLLENEKDGAQKTRTNTIKNNRNSVITSNMNTGTLVDCEIVSQIILSHLQDIHQNAVEQTTSTLDEYDELNSETITYPYSYQRNDVFLKEQPYHRQQKHSHFIMDGYPRTKRQIDIMIQTWPVQYHITHAIHLDIPNSICEAKMLGRRHCLQCEGTPNIAHVNEHGFHLPPLTPLICKRAICRPPLHWIIARPDDNDITILQKRLLEYRQQETALLEYYQSQQQQQQQQPQQQPQLGRCISVTPYHGIDDFFQMQQMIEAWMLQQEQHVPKKKN